MAGGDGSPPMMFEELHTGRKQAPSMMIEKVMIQLGVHFNRKGGGEGHQRGTGDAEDAKKPKPQKPNREEL